MIDDAQFESAYRAYAPSVVRYCTYSAGSQSIGEDLAAETFTRYLEKGASVPAGRTEAWLIRVARNLCVSHHRAERRNRQFAASCAVLPEHTEDEWVPTDVWHHTRKLKESERLVIYLRVAEERPFAEIARQVGTSEGAARMTFYRALERIRASIDRERATAPKNALEV